MRIGSRILATACAGLLLSVATLPASAAQLNVGGISVGTGSGAGGGTGVSVGSGGSSVGATVGGGANVASVNTNASGNGTTVGVGNTNGPLVASTTNPDGSTSANVNLGGLGTGGLGTGDLGLGNLGLGDLGGLGGGDLGGLLPGDNGGGGDGNAAAARIEVAFGSMGAGEQRQLRLRCQSILSAPRAFDANLVALCRMIAKIGATP